MSVGNTNDPRKWHKTRHRGIVFRHREGGARTYYVFADGKYLAAGGTEKEALARQAELRGKAARGEVPVTPSKARFCDIADAYMDSKKRLRPGTRMTYRATLNRVLIPEFGNMRVAVITVDHVAAFLHKLAEKDGLAASTVQAYLMPPRGVMGYAERKGLVTVNPCDKLTRDDRPQTPDRRKKPVWSDSDIAALIEASERLAKKPDSRYDYSPVIRVAAYTGLRLGELLGLQWRDIDFQKRVLRIERQWLRPFRASEDAKPESDYGPPKTKAGLRTVPLNRDTRRGHAGKPLASRISATPAPDRSA